MNKDVQAGPSLALFFFILQVCINWLYILWVKMQPGIIANAWFFITPVIGYFYFAFAFISAIGLFYKRKLGLLLGYFVILFGTISTVISYTIAYNKVIPLVEQVIIPLIVVNLLVLCYMAYHQKQFQSNS